MQESDGVIRTVKKFDSNLRRAKSPSFRSKKSKYLSTHQVSNSPALGKIQHTAPVSFSETAYQADPRGTPKKRRAPERSSSRLAKAKSPKHEELDSRFVTCQNSSLATPDHHLDENLGEQSSQPRQLRSSNHSETPVSRAETPTIIQESNASHILSPQSQVPRTGSFPNEIIDREYGQLEDAQPEAPSSWTGWHEDVSASKMSVYADEITSINSPPSVQLELGERARPTVLDTTATLDMSLPSPSLSPVTAAANLQHRRGYFDEQTFTDSGISARTDPLSRMNGEGVEDKTFEAPLSDPQTVIAARADSQLSREGDFMNQQIATPSVMGIPTMLNSFDLMSEEVKQYVIYQLLRRCPKPVLHFIADTVNPALKCDFLSLLPIELSLNIIGRLDVKSLCRAAQVSKKWRQMIDSDEKAWKRLFDTNGFILPEGELLRAIREGWGWQHVSHPDDWEKDLTASGQAVSDTEMSVSSAYVGLAGASMSTTPVSGTTSTQSRRSKRKACPSAKARSRKQQKRVEDAMNAAADRNHEGSIDDAYAAEGPYAAASAAASAVPNAQVGLPRLRNLHLFKSIYQRHHAIRKSWMDLDTKPRHIAFRAHQRHVVTCLQFDTDKILTGSDDTNINVYDTQTGALRARLEGHEGGVWALQYEGNVLVSGSTDRSVRVWDIEKGECTHVFQGHTSTVRCLQILMPAPVKLADGRTTMMPKEPLIITGSRDSNLRVWRLPKSGDKSFIQAGPAADETDCPYFVRVLVGHHHSVRAIAAHGDTLVSGSYDCNVRVWKISTGETLFRLQGHTQKVYSVVLDHKRNRCISGSMDHLVKVWSLETGLALFTLEGHSSLVGLLDLQQDRLVSAAADFTLRIWDPENGQCKSILNGHTGAITCFQHDGQKVISGSDRTLKMWNVADGELVKDLLTDLSGVWQVKFNDRRCVAAVQRNNLTYIEVLTNLQYPKIFY